MSGKTRRAEIAARIVEQGHRDVDAVFEIAFNRLNDRLVAMMERASGLD